MNTGVYNLFYETLDPLIFPLTGLLDAFGKTTTDIEEIYFGLKIDREDEDDSLASLYYTVGNGVQIDEPNMKMIINVQDFIWASLEKGATYEACFGIKFIGEAKMREERITLTKDKKPIKQIYIAKDSVRA